MYSVAVVGYGLKVRMHGSLTSDELQAWCYLYMDRLHQVSRRGGPFGQILDLRGITPVRIEALVAVLEAMRQFKKSRGFRSALILETNSDAREIQQRARELGVNTWERYLDAETTRDVERAALAWVVEGKDPGLKQSSSLP